MKLLKLLLLIGLLFHLQLSKSQTIDKTEYNKLFTAGYAHAFIGGLYDGNYPYDKLKQHGDFGLGAPDKLDGELLLLKGKIYQTLHTGKTYEIKEGSTPYAVVNFFKADTTFQLYKKVSEKELYRYLDSLLINANGMYAIHLTGSFAEIKTRAFPQATNKPYQTMAQMLPLQHFFNYKSIWGDLVGYKLPQYMDGANIAGYHFHFLSDDKTSGGHLINFVAQNLRIEIDYLNTFEVSLPQSEAFKNYDFKQDRREELKSIESGKH